MASELVLIWTATHNHAPLQIPLEEKQFLFPLLHRPQVELAQEQLVLQRRMREDTVRMWMRAGVMLQYGESVTVLYYPQVSVWSLGHHHVAEALQKYLFLQYIHHIHYILCTMAHALDCWHFARKTQDFDIVRYHPNIMKLMEGNITHLM